MKAIDELQFFADASRAAQETEPGQSAAAAPEAVPSARHLRSHRPREGRAKTIAVREMTQQEMAVGRALYPETDYWKPRARGECVEGPRPCPYVSCAHHLYLDVSRRTGALKLNFPDLEVWEMGESCALDVAAFGGAKLEEVGVAINLTRERVRQIEVKALARLERLRDMMALRELVDEGPHGRRRLPVLAPTDEEDDEDGEEEEQDEDDADEG